MIQTSLAQYDWQRAWQSFTDIFFFAQVMIALLMQITKVIWFLFLWYQELVSTDSHRCQASYKDLRFSQDFSFQSYKLHSIDFRLESTSRSALKLVVCLKYMNIDCCKKNPIETSSGRGLNSICLIVQKYHTLFITL